MYVLHRKLQLEKLQTRPTRKTSNMKYWLSLNGGVTVIVYTLFYQFYTSNIGVRMAGCSPKYMLSFHSVEFAKKMLLGRNYISQDHMTPCLPVECKRIGCMSHEAQGS